MRESNCSMCNKKIDKSNCRDYWVTITRKLYYKDGDEMVNGRILVSDTKIPTKRITICSDCTLKHFSHELKQKLGKLHKED